MSVKCLGLVQQPYRLCILWSYYTIIYTRVGMALRAVFQTSSDVNKGLSSDAFSPTVSQTVWVWSNHSFLLLSLSLFQTPAGPKGTRRATAWSTTSSPNTSLRQISTTTSRHNSVWLKWRKEKNRPHSFFSDHIFIFNSREPFHDVSIYEAVHCECKSGHTAHLLQA